jgi:uroporphyrinogen decarboxylase
MTSKNVSSAPSPEGLPLAHPIVAGRTDDAPLLCAAKNMARPHTPVWFMRQAGRSLPEYRALREGTAMLDACFDTGMITEITMQPVRRHKVDAAIFFSDIVVPLVAIGVDIDIKAGVGPVVAKPFRSMADVDRLRDLDANDVASVLAAVSRLTDPDGELGTTPLIGFAGAPFTLASYLVEGGPSKDHRRTKALMHGEPQVWHALAERLARIAGDFLRLQVEHGASAVQLFDSWAGALSVRDYRTFVQPHSAKALAAVADLPVPRIHFGVGTGELLSSMAEAGVEVMGVDFRVPLTDAGSRVPSGLALQGNLDPALLFAPWSVVESEVRRIVAEAATTGRGHIFNLGHGVLPETDPDVLTRVVALVHELTSVN